MVTTANEKLYDVQVRHAVGLHRYQSSVLNKMVRLLNNSEMDLSREIDARLAKLEGRGVTLGKADTNRLIALRDAVRAQLGEVHKQLRENLTGELKDFAKYEADFQISALGASLPVELDLATVPAPTLNALVTSRPFNGKVLNAWAKQLERNDVGRVTDAIQRGIVEGKTPTDISRMVFGTKALAYKDGVREVTRRGTAALVQTAFSAVHTNAREEVWKANEDIMSGVRYTATLDSKTTLICASLDGKVFAIGKGPRPPQHVNCRSVTVPVINGKVVGTRPEVKVTERTGNEIRDEYKRRVKIDGKEAAEEWRRKEIQSRVGRVPADTKFDPWLRKQSDSFAREYLGETRFRLFKDGQLTLDKFVQPNGKPWSLNELRRREAQAWEEVFGKGKKPPGGTGSTPPPKPKPAPTPAPVVPKDWATKKPQTEFEQHKQFTPNDEIKRVVDKVPSLTGSVIRSQVDEGFYHPSQLSITLPKQTGQYLTPRAQASVWFHEYGHHVDYSFKYDGVKASLHLPGEARLPMSANAGSAIQADRNALREYYSDPMGEKRAAYYKQARETDERFNTLWEQKDGRAAVLSEIEANLKTRGIASDDFWEFIHTSNPNVKEDFLVRNDGSAQRVRNAAAKFFAAWDNDNFHELLRTPVFDSLISATSRMDSGMYDKLQDFFSAVTDNLKHLPWGHSSDYYKKFGSIAGTKDVTRGHSVEAFANFYAFTAQPANTLYLRIAQRMAPKTASEFTKMIEAVKNS